jgi:4'-phosphopantetheinyl transferase
LRAGDVQVVCVSLVRTADELAILRETLTDDERERADRFVFARDRERYTVARAELRRLLANHLGAPPRICYGAHGKPALVGGGLAFNVSHAHDLGVIAVACDREIGVDVEREREVDIAGLATRYFSPREREELLALPDAERLAAFFRCWTRKEAYVKARGEGLAIPLDAFTVSIGRQTDVTLAADDAARWSLRALDVDPGYAAAIAVSTGSLHGSIS